MKFVPCYRTDFSELCSVLFCFVFSWGKATFNIFCAEDQVNWGIPLLSDNSSFFFPCLYNGEDFLCLGELCGQCTSVRGRLMQTLAISSFFPLQISESSRKGRKRSWPYGSQLSELYLCLSALSPRLFCSTIWEPSVVGKVVFNHTFPPLRPILCIYVLANCCPPAGWSVASLWYMPKTRL